jgi:putative zinc finger protein
MSCHDARELFSALIDETLTREERADVYGHLATCAECRRELAAIERTVALVRGATPVRAPAGFVDRVVAAARPMPWYVRAARAALLPWPVKLPLGAAAVVLVAGLAVLMFRGSQEQQSAARYDAPPPVAAPPVLADRRVTEMPAEAPGAPAPTAPARPPAAPPPSAPPEAASSDRIGAAGHADRTAAASRIDPAQKRSEQELRAESKMRDAAPPAAGEPTLAKREGLRQKAADKADVVASLAAPDRDTAERGVVALVARLGGTLTSRRVEGDAAVIEVAIPGDRYKDFAREIGRLGTFSVESEPPAPPDPIRIAIRLAS